MQTLLKSIMTLVLVFGLFQIPTAFLYDGVEANDSNALLLAKETEGFNVRDIFNTESDRANEPGNPDIGSENITENFINEGEEVGSPVEAIILRAINLMAMLIGTFAFVMLVIGGFMFVSSGGEESRIERAKSIMSQTIVGLVIGMLSYLIVTFVISFFY